MYINDSLILRVYTCTHEGTNEGIHEGIHEGTNEGTNEGIHGVAGIIEIYAI